jgi:hypothetical protein
MHRYIGEQLRILDTNEQREWDRHIYVDMFSFRNGQSAAHDNTPAFLMHGRDPPLPGELLTMSEIDLRQQSTRSHLPQLLRLRHADDRP